MKNKFYEFSEPYHALLSTSNPIKAIEKYKENVSGEDVDDDELVFKEVTYETALSKAYEEVLDNAKDYSKLKKLATKLAKLELSKGDLILIDKSLL